MLLSSHIESKIINKMLIAVKTRYLLFGFCNICRRKCYKSFSVCYIVSAIRCLVGVESSLDSIEADNAILQVDRHWHPICLTS